MVDVIQVTTTVATRQDADRLSRLVLAERLAACVQISDCCSLYHWQGAVEQSDEYKLVMKSRPSLYVQLEQCLLENHPYDTPEILAIPVLSVSSGYLKWMQAELQPE